MNEFQWPQPAASTPERPLTPAEQTPVAPTQALGAAAPAEQSAQQAPQASSQENYKPLKPLNFRFDLAYSTPVSEFDASAIALMLPSASRQGTMQALANSARIKNPNLARIQEYTETLQGGILMGPAEDDQDELRGRDGAMYVQQIESTGKKLKGFVPSFKVRQGVSPTGEYARNLVRSRLRLGTIFSIPLWHSGFWVTVHTPSENDLIELHRRMTQDRIEIGRSARGLLYNGMSSYTTAVFRDFIEEHMHSSSLKLAEDQSVMEHVRMPDLQLLVWGMACATWPNGFQFKRACVTDVEKCQHVVSELLNLSELLVVDENALTSSQKAHMAKRDKNSMSVEEVKAYQQAFQQKETHVHHISNNAKMVLRMPLLNDYIAAGYRWIGELEEKYGKAMGMDEKKRNDYLLSQAQAQSMRQYEHYVESIIISDDDGKDYEINDKEDLGKNLADLSSDDTIRRAFIAAVIKFQTSYIFSFIGIPNYRCPSCGGMQNPTAIPGRDHELIVLDSTQVFFSLLMQRLDRIKQR